jgi:hypothetical protein
MKYKEEFYNKLDWDTIKINWNKNPIPMSDFLKFLTVKCDRSEQHLGSSNGWTKLFNKDAKLEISGGVVNGIEYLDSLQYGERLHNPYNNYVNPFYLFDIMTHEGKLFFYNYYKPQIDKIVESLKDDIDFHTEKTKQSEEILSGVRSEIDNFLIPGS